MYLTKLPSGNWRAIVQHAGRKLSGTGPTKAAAQQIGASLLLELGGSERCPACGQVIRKHKNAR